MGCGCKGRDGPMVVYDGWGVAGNNNYSEESAEEWLGDDGSGLKRTVHLTIDLTGMALSETAEWTMTVEGSQDGKNWTVVATAFANTLMDELAVQRRASYEATFPRVRLRLFLVAGSSNSPIHVKVTAHRDERGDAESPARPAPPDAMARRLLADTLTPAQLDIGALVRQAILSEPDEKENIRELVRQTMAEERAALVLAERRKPQRKLVLDQIMSPSVLSALSDCEFERFLGDYDRLGLFIEAIPTSMTGSPTISVDRAGSINGKNFAFAEGLASAITLTSAGLFLHVGSVQPGTGLGRITVTINVGAGSWTGRVRIWATPWFEEKNDNLADRTRHIVTPPTQNTLQAPPYNGA